MPDIPGDVRDAVLLASGGMDSTVMAHWLMKNDIVVHPLFVDYGQHSASKEYRTLIDVLPVAIKSSVQLVRIVDLYKDSASKMIVPANLWTEHVTDEDLYVPGRNLLILSIGAAYAGSIGVPNLFSAFIESNLATGRDCTDGFLRSAGKLIKELYGINLFVPFSFMSKKAVASLGCEVGAPIDKTFSCLASPDIPCGACANCADRELALESLEKKSNG